MVFDEVEGDRYLTKLEEGYRWDITINAESNTGQGVVSEETGWESRSKFGYCFWISIKPHELNLLSK